MTTLVIFVLIVAAVLITINYRKMRREFALRHGPRGAKVLLEVMLPRDIKDANVRMARLYRMIASLTVPDGPERREGKGQIDLLFYAARKTGKLSPTLRFFVECDVDKFDRVKKSINTCFDGDAEIILVSPSPLAKIEADLLARAASQGGKLHQQQAVEQ